MRRYFFLIFCFCTALGTKAQLPERFIPFSVSDGLSQNSVHCIFQDSDGILWLGTQDGLNSFDGHNFKVYRHNRNDTNTLSDQFILSITEDKTGFLWVGTGNGLNRLNRRTGIVQRFYFDPEEQKRITSHYSLLTRNNEGEVFIRHYKSPTIVGKSGSRTVLDSLFTGVNSACFTNDLIFWGILTQKKSLISVKNIATKPEIRKIKNVPDAIWSNKTGYQLKADSENKLWFYPIEDKGPIYLYHSAIDSWQLIIKEAPGIINDVLLTGSGTAWLCTREGIYLVKNYKDIIKLSSTLAGLPSGSILTAYEDRQQNIWVGSANGGITYYNTGFDNFKLFTSGWSSDVVTSVVDMDESIRWMGTTNGLYKMDIKTTGGNKQTTAHLFAGKRVTSLTKDQQRNLWVAVQDDGLYILGKNGAIIKKHNQNDSLLQSTRVLYLFCDSKNRVFVCTETGYFVFSSPFKWSPFYRRYRKPVGTGWYVLHAFEDRNKNIWLSKHLGIDILDSNLVQKFTIESGYNNSPISRTLITGCTEDKQGGIWIATLSSGIYRYVEKELTQYTTAEGLNSNSIMGIVTDNKGRIWATTTSGINVYVPGENRFYQLTGKDGLPSNDFLLGALFKNEQGDLLTGSSKGLIQINANNIALQSKKVEARISDLRINGSSVETQNGYYLVPPGSESILFEFAVKESLQPRLIYYQYRLRGVDDNWVTLKADNPFITFSKLPYKKLIMEVRASYSLPDMENAPIEKFVIELKPPFAQTLGFKIMMALLALGILFYLVRMYNRRKLKQQQEALRLQKELQQERERISRDLHDNIGAYTSALIAGLNQIKTQPENNPEHITELSDYASNIMGYLRETIWVLSSEKLTLLAFSDRFKNYATRMVRNYPGLTIDFTTRFTTLRELSPQISLNLFRILQEALQNACKHANASIIHVVFSSEAKIEFSLSDNGKGISDEKRDDSYGLQNMRQRAADIGFNLVINSYPANGTQLVLTEK